MIQPLIFFSIIFFIIFIAIRFANNHRQKDYDLLILSLMDQTILFIQQAKSSNSTFGLKNREYLFNRCDLYLTNDAMIILGYTKDSFFKQLSKPIVITENHLEYLNRFPFAIVKKPNRLSFDNQTMIIELGEKDLQKTEALIKISNLTESQTKSIKNSFVKNCS